LVGVLKTVNGTSMGSFFSKKKKFKRVTVAEGKTEKQQPTPQISLTTGNHVG